MPREVFPVVAPVRTFRRHPPADNWPLPRVCHRLAQPFDSPFDAAQFQLGHAQTTIVAEMLHLLGEFALLSSQLGDPSFGLGHPRGQRLPAFLQIGGGRSFDFMRHILVGEVGADHRDDLLVQFLVAFAQLGQAGFVIDQVVELLGGCHATLGPQGASLLLATLERTMVGDLLPLELQVLFLQLTTPFDPVLLA